jgi:hypothetical protein
VRPLGSIRTLFALAVLAMLAVIASACTVSSGSVSQPSGGGPTPTQGTPPFIPQIISSESVVGPSRFLFGILDAAGSKTIAAPDLKVSVGFLSAGEPAPDASASPAPSAPPPSPIPAKPATFIWAITNERGVYVLDVTFPSAGVWTAAFTTSGGSVPAATVGVSFDVKTTGVAIPVGGRAPATKTRTATTAAEIARIATDPTPDPTFYTTSVDEALAKHEPFVLVFATPAFCTSKQCGPTLDGIKAVAKGEPGIVFMNVEPYKLQYADGHLQPVLDAAGQLQATDVVRAWGILSEPWVFVVDRDGIVRGSFEAVVSPEELKAAIAAVR